MIDDPSILTRQRVAAVVQKSSNGDLVAYHNLAYALANGEVTARHIADAKRLFEQVKREVEGKPYTPASDYTPHSVAA